MALLHADGCAHIDAATQIGRIYNTVHGPSLSPAALGGTLVSGPYGPDGSQAYRFSGDSADGITRAVSPGDATFIKQTFFNSSLAPSANVIIGPILSGAVQCSLVLNGSTFEVHKGTAGGTLLGSVTYTYTPGTLVYIRFKVLIDSSAGTVRVDIYETPYTTPTATLTLTSKNTQNGASATYDSYEISAACTGDTDFSQMIAMDGTGSTMNDLIDPPDLVTAFASIRAAPSLNDFSLTGGSSAGAVLSDATPDDDSSYAGSSTQNQQQTVFVDLLPHGDRDIKGMQLYVCAKKGSGSPTIVPIARQSGTVYAGSSYSPGASYAYAMQPYSAMPDGSAISTVGRIDALQWGAKLTSAGDPVRITQVVVVFIASRTRHAGRRNLIYGHTPIATGDDNFIVGEQNVITGTASAALGANGTVDADRAVLVNLDGTPRTVSEAGKMTVGGKFDVTDLAQLLGGLKVLTSDPSSPADGAAWLFDDGGSPRSLSIRWRTGGTTYDLPIGTATT